MALPIRRIAVNTGGGDAPGLNAVIRAVVLSALRRGWEVLGIRKGYEGLIDTSQILPLTRDSVRGITHVGGTILGTTNKGDPYRRVVEHPDGTREVIDVSARVIENFHRLELDALIAIGGDGSLQIAYHFFEQGLPVVGVPKTIDNDLSHTVVTFGFDTAVTVATEALDRLHSTAEAHERVMVVEVMGRYAGWIALNSGLAASCDVILIPEIPFDYEAVCAKILEREAAGRHFSIVVAAEGARPIGGTYVMRTPAQPGGQARLGGIGEQVAEEIARRTGKECRVVVLGHLQRGGAPTTFDRLIALRFGAAAVRVAAEGQFGVMVALDPPDVRTVPLAAAISRMKSVPLDCDSILTARDLGICLGDRWPA
ncbi:MAG: ATP-dependent 6-phosphofructokinase [Pirellulales bacterium]|nr:ATP-dependent 6-phosphofructokinase [Pirellulales bacterium]